MFIKVQKRETKNKGITYNFYSCDKVDGKRKDTYVIKINESDFIDGKLWEDVLAEGIKDRKLFKMVHEKACSIWRENYKVENTLWYKCDAKDNVQLYYGDEVIIIFNKNNCSSDEISSKIYREQRISFTEVSYSEIVAFVRKLYGENKISSRSDLEQKIKIRQLESDVEYWKTMASLNFSNTKNVSLDKKEYITLSKCCHPDNGGSNEAMQILNKLYNK